MNLSKLLQVAGRHVVTGSLLFAAVLMAGCEGAGAPLGDPDEMLVDQAVLGHWRAASEDGDEARLRVWAFNDHEYYVEWESVEPGEQEEDLVRLRVYASDLGTFVFANVQCVNCELDDRNEWFFYQFEIESPDVLLIREIEDNHYADALSQMTRSQDVRRYVEQHMTDQGFFSRVIMRMNRYDPEESAE